MGVNEKNSDPEKVVKNSSEELSISAALKLCQLFSAEFFGTFFLAFMISSTKISPILDGQQPLAIGFVLMVLVFVLGPISGGQFNPAVTLGVFLRGNINVLEAVSIMASQFAGAIMAGLCAHTMYNDDWDNIGYPSISPTSTTESAAVGEWVVTTLLVFTVLSVATTEKSKGNSYFGMAIGFVVLSGAATVGGVSGGCFNPAVAMLSALNDATTDELLVYLLAPLAGSVTAILLFALVYPREVANTSLLHPLCVLVRGTGGCTDKASLISRIVMEGLGSFFLVFTISISSLAAPSVGFIAIGCLLSSIVYSGGPVSGGHYNPAVTLGVYLRGAFAGIETLSTIEMTSYFAAQSIGGSLAALLAGVVVTSGDVVYPSVSADHTVGAALLAEMLITLVLVTTVLSCTTNTAVDDNSYFGISIGFIVASGIAAVGDISGAAFNPMVAVCLQITHNTTDADSWLYVLGPLLSGVLAAIVFHLWMLGSDNYGLPAPTRTKHVQRVHAVTVEDSKTLIDDVTA